MGRQEMVVGASVPVLTVAPAAAVPVAPQESRGMTPAGAAAPWAPVPPVAIVAAAVLTLAAVLRVAALLAATAVATYRRTALGFSGIAGAPPPVCSSARTSRVEC